MTARWDLTALSPHRRLFYGADCVHQPTLAELLVQVAAHLCG